MIVALWSGKGAFLPEGYDEYTLCRHIYHCTPNQLKEQPALIAQRDLAIWNGEQEVIKRRRELAQK